MCRALHNVINPVFEPCKKYLGKNKHLNLLGGVGVKGRVQGRRNREDLVEKGDRQAETLKLELNGFS